MGTIKIPVTDYTTDVHGVESIIASSTYLYNVYAIIVKGFETTPQYVAAHAPGIARMHVVRELQDAFGVDCRVALKDILSVRKVNATTDALNWVADRIARGYVRGSYTVTKEYREQDDN